MRSANSMADIRGAAEKVPAFKEAVQASLQAPMELMQSTLSRLKDQPFTVLPAAEDEFIDALWAEMQAVDDQLALAMKPHKPRSRTGRGGRPCSSTVLRSATTFS